MKRNGKKIRFRKEFHIFFPRIFSLYFFPFSFSISFPYLISSLEFFDPLKKHFLSFQKLLVLLPCSYSILIYLYPHPSGNLQVEEKEIFFGKKTSHFPTTRIFLSSLFLSSTIAFSLFPTAFSLFSSAFLQFKNREQTLFFLPLTYFLSFLSSQSPSSISLQNSLPSSF